MAKRKKKITEAELNREPVKIKNNLIQDTSAGPLLLDINIKEEGKMADGLLTLQTQFPPRTNSTYSFRISGDLVEHFKNEARKVSLEKKEDVNWQRLIVGAALAKYPFSKEE